MRTKIRSMFLALLANIVGTASALAESESQQSRAAQELPISWTGIEHDFFTLLLLCLLGAIGGYLYAIQRRISGVEQNPHEITWFHCLQGAAGAVIIVNLSPVDLLDNLFTSSGQQLFVKFVALALIGGYAGGALLESSAGQYSKIDKSLGELKETTTNIEKTTATRFEGIEEKTGEIQRRQNELAEEARKGEEARRTAEMILRGLILGSEKTKEFERTLEGASPSVRLQIAFLANDCRRQNWEKDKDVMERALLIFNYLVRTDEAEDNYWWFASLGYCLKDKNEPDYVAAVEWLDKAIQHRSLATRSGSYEFNRAFCNIKIAETKPSGPATRELDEKIRKDLEAAGKFSRFNDVISQDATVQRWVQRNEVKPTQVPARA